MQIKTRLPNTDIERCLINDPYYAIRFNHFMSSSVINGKIYDVDKFSGYILRAVLSRLNRLGTCSLKTYDDQGNSRSLWNFDANDVHRLSIEFGQNYEAAEVIVRNFFSTKYGEDLVDRVLDLNQNIVFVPFQYYICAKRSSSSSVVVGKVVLKVDGHVLIKK
ncbi:hypothetical protein HY498_04700 [Candidatus Woesearchaeota archaeon]|nr:hypothetical protein [Candidatus Woesearchaeota archaeon]